MPKFNFPEWIEVFATGKWTDAAGHESEWTTEDLREIASLYKPEIYEAPIVIGHPETDSPAFGWIEGLKVEGEKLLAKPKQIIDEFKDWVQRGLYKKISISLFPDMTLRHVGFLGGAAPAVKGLKPVSFGEKKAEWTFTYSPSLLAGEGHPHSPSPMRGEGGGEGKDNPGDSTPLDQEGVNHNPKKGGIKMDLRKFFSDLSALVHGAEKELVPDDPSRKFTESDLQAKVKETQDLAFAEAQKKIDAEKKEKEEAQKKLKEIEATARKEGIASFCETLCKEGKLTPALRQIIEPVMIAVSEIPEPIEFSEGVKKSRLEGIKDFLTELPKVVTFREVVPKEGPNSGGTAGEKLSALTKKKMDEKKDLSYSAAFAEVQKENVELAKELLEEIRPKQ
jgi:hypothetical protein